MNPDQWTIAAAVSQIIAVIFALVAVRQAATAIKLAEKQTRLSVAPCWELPAKLIAPEWDHEKFIHRADFKIRNDGFGVGRSFSVKFLSKNGNEPIPGDSSPEKLSSDPIAVGQSVEFKLYWHKDHPLDGVLRLSSVSILGFWEHQDYFLSSQYFAGNRCYWLSLTPTYGRNITDST